MALAVRVLYGHTSYILIINPKIVPPPNAGPNWARNREKTLAKYARATKRRHKKHEKKMRDQAAGKVPLADHWDPGMEDAEQEADEDEDEGPMG